MLLEVVDLDSGYGDTQVLWGISLRALEGGFVSVLGPNGAGKTTLLNTIMGFIKPWRGRIVYGGIDITKLPPHKKVELGINIVPEGRRLFPDLTVRENLLLATRVKRARNNIDASLDLVFTLFPVLRERLDQKAGTLSGGEQQMLAIARVLMTRPRLILMDEPSQGLAPKVALEVLKAIVKLREIEKISLLLVEQSVKMAIDISEYIYLIDHGRIILQGTNEEISSKSRDLLRSLIGI
ncbi:MAG: ABC transporter ATP-binding protein [Sulfolobales archaeon]